MQKQKEACESMVVTELSTIKKHLSAQPVGDGSPNFIRIAVQYRDKVSRMSRKQNSGDRRTWQ